MLSDSKNNESISSINDTILKDIRDHDENEIYTSSPNIHERTLNSLAHEWSMCDIFEINESEGETQCANNEKNETDLQTKVTKQNIVTHSQNMLNETNSHWQDNKAFTQLDPCKSKDNILECFQVINNFNIYRIIKFLTLDLYDHYAFQNRSHKNMRTVLRKQFPQKP